MLKKTALFSLASLIIITSGPIEAKMWNTSQDKPLPFALGGGIGYGGSAHGGMGYNATLGYSFNKNIAAAFDFFMTPAFKDNGHTYNYLGSLKLSLPLPNRIARHWTPFMQAGAAFTHWSVQHGDHLGFAAGAGVDYMIQANLSVGAKFIYIFTVENPKIAVATAAYHF